MSANTMPAAPERSVAIGSAKSIRAADVSSASVIETLRALGVTPKCARAIEAVGKLAHECGLILVVYGLAARIAAECHSTVFLRSSRKATLRRGWRRSQGPTNSWNGSPEFGSLRARGCSMACGLCRSMMRRSRCPHSKRRSLSHELDEKAAHGARAMHLRAEGPQRRAGKSRLVQRRPRPFPSGRSHAR